MNTCQSQQNKQINFKEILSVDKVTFEGYNAGLVGKRLPPSKYIGDDVMICAWTIGNQQGLARAATTAKR